MSKAKDVAVPEGMRGDARPWIACPKAGKPGTGLDDSWSPMAFRGKSG